VNSTLRYLLLLPLCISTLTPQEPAALEAAPAAKCTIEGRVVNASTGAALKKVTLSLHKMEGSDRPAVARSDASGRFTLRGVEPGKYRLSASRTGYAHQQFGSRGRMGSGTVLTLEPGQQLTGLVFRLYPQGVIAGVVLDSDGEPVVEAEVEALQYEYSRRKKQLQQVQQARTNDLGEFRIFGLVAGRYYISANSASREMRWGMSPRGAPGGEAEQAYAPTYYPGTVDPASASPVEVAAGAEVRGVQLTLQRVPTARIRGRVVNPFTTGRDRETFVSLAPRQQGLWVFGYRSYPVSDPDGNFEIRGVVPGSYTLMAEWRQGELRHTGRKKLDVTTDLDGVVVEIAPGFEVSGVLKVEGKADVNHADLRVVLSPRDEDPMGGRSTTVKDDGSFTLRHLDPDQYRFDLHGAPENCYLRSVRLGRQEVLESGFELTGPPSDPLEVFLSADGGRLEGEVLDERKKPVRGARVALVPEPSKRDLSFLYKNITTDQSGRFSIVGIAPGEYKLFAWDTVEEDAWEDPEFLNPLEELGKPVRASPNGRESVSLMLLPSGEPAPKAPEARPPKPRAKGARP